MIGSSQWPAGNKLEIARKGYEFIWLYIILNYILESIYRVQKDNKKKEDIGITLWHFEDWVLLMTCLPQIA